jgi:O-antigen/teichoic acid export membrane protein
LAAEPAPLTAGAGAAARAGYGRGARILSVGIATTGLVTFAYFSLASYHLGKTEYGFVSTLWAILFITISVIYRPVEQLLSRTIADRRARGLPDAHPLRGPVVIQAAFAALFLVAAFALRGTLEGALGGSALFWVLVGSALAYAGSYFARGYCAGHGWFGLYGGLVFFEALARVCFPLAAVLGLASGRTWVALGILAAPVASLAVVAVALRRHAERAPEAARPAAAQAGAPPTVPAGAGAGAAAAAPAGGDGRFAVAVAGIGLGEQALLNVAVLLVPAGDAAGVVFNAFLITRVPLQLFQSVQTSLLPHLAGLEVTEGAAAFGRAIRTTLLAVAGFAVAVALGLLLLGPFALELLLNRPGYSGIGLAAVALGMGAHLAAGTLNQAALARGRATAAAALWLTAAAAFTAWMLLEPITDALARAEVGYLGATSALAAGLWGLYRRGRTGAPS